MGGVPTHNIKHTKRHHGIDSSDRHLDRRNIVTTMTQTNTRAQLSLGLADRTHGAHSQPASITVRV